MSIIIKNLDKTYKVKKGVDVHALKGISFNLPDMGMVFILGKSGCGKSTLLNVLGGLDGFDDGDITVDGKSLKGYKAKELDRYRNDYVGFVFQENNLLEKESVKRNVSLALELKSEKDTEGRIESALESVGIKELADKKCNCISGGQKQRVAIARALIKEPKLLLCDEPTGALDSETGGEIFTLLKELSKERLVVVVSHDRESAESYGDRVIELKDGEKEYDSAPYEPAETKEKSAPKKHGGLSFKRAFTLGASYIIAKPARMAICLILCLLTFVSVGVFDAFYSYDSEKVLLKKMNETEFQVYTFAKGKFCVNHVSEVFDRVTETEAKEIKSLLMGENDYDLNVKRCDNVYDVNYSYLKELEGVHDNVMLGLYATVNAYIEADDSFLNDYNLTLVAGRMPQSNDEVALPLFLYNFYKTYGYRGADGVLVEINSYEDIFGKTITSGYLPTLKITGVVDTHFRWKECEDKLYGGVARNDFGFQLQITQSELIHNALFVNIGFDKYYMQNYAYDPDELQKSSRIFSVIAPFEGRNGQKLKNLRIAFTEFDGKPVNTRDGSCYYNTNFYSKRIMVGGGDITEMNEYILYVDLLMVVITTLFIVFYSGGTIDEKRREVGILRALGASRGDVMKIFGSEHGIFTAASVAVSSILSVIALIIANIPFSKEAGTELGIKFVSFGIRQFGVLLGVALLSVIVGIAVPLIKLLIKKPVDVIADRK